MSVSFRVVGTFAGGRAVQHVLLVHDRHGPRGLVCEELYELARFFHVEHHSEAATCLAASGASEVNCASCRQRLQCDYVFDPEKPRSLVGQIACDLRDKTEDELEEILARVEKRSAMWNAVHLERYRRETGIEY